VPNGADRRPGYFPARSRAQKFLALKGPRGPIMGFAVSPTGQVASASFENS